MTQRFHSPSGKKSKPNPIGGCRVLLLLAAAACVNAMPRLSARLVVQPDTSDNRVDCFYWAEPEPGPEHGNADIPDPCDDGHVTVQLTDSTCWDYKEDPTFEGSGWDSIGPYSALLQYDASNPVCAYEGHWDGPLKIKPNCSGNGSGNGGGNGVEKSFTLDTDGKGPEYLHIQRPNSPDEQGPFILCVGCNLTVESAIFTENATSAVPCDWTVNGILALNDSNTFDIPGDFPASLLDSSGIQDPGSYSLEAEYQCPENTGTLTAAASHTAVKVDTQIKYYEDISGNQIWVDEVEAVAGDKISFRLVSPAFVVNQFAWDFNDYSNDDATDADQDGIDENDDDTDNNTTFTPSFTYNIPPLSHNHILYTVNCNVENTGGSVCNATVHVKVNEVLVASGHDDNSWWEGYIQDSAVLVMAHFDDMGYRTDYKHEPPWGTFHQEVLPYYNVLYVCGHGPDSASWDDSLVDVAGLRLNECDGYRKLQRTTEGTFRKYRFVHFNACHSASNDWLTKYKTALDAESILGWRKKVLMPHARAFDYYFYNKLKNGLSTAAATILANNATIVWFYTDRATPKCLGSVTIKK